MGFIDVAGWRVLLGVLCGLFRGFGLAGFGWLGGLNMV